MTNVVPVPEVVLTVTVSASAPAAAGLKVAEPVVQDAPEAMVAPAVQEPTGTLKSVLSEEVKGVADRTTGPPEAVRVTVPVQVALDPALIAGHDHRGLVEPAAVKLPYVPVTLALIVRLATELATVRVVLLAPAEVGVKET